MKTPPIDHNAIRVALVRAVMAATDLDQNHVIMSEPEVANSPRPTRPYMALKLTTVGARYGNDVPEQVAGGWVYKGPRMFVASFHVYGTSHEEAYDLMSLWQTALGMEPVRAMLAADGISVLLPGAITDLSALVDTAYEGRAHMDCRFGVTSYATADLGEIASADVGGQAADADAITGTVAIGPFRITVGG